MYSFQNIPPQKLPWSKKTKEWRKKHVDWADGKTYSNNSLIRNSILHKKVNQDLVEGKLHMEDVSLVLDAENLGGGFIPDSIQHYPIINSKLNILRGEESKRRLEYRATITNPNAISELEKSKKAEAYQKLTALIEQKGLDEEQFNAEVEKLNEYFMYEWQDIREIRANCLLNHYTKELNFKYKINCGFMDAMTFAEELYQCDIVQGEPIFEKLNPKKVRLYKSGYSNRAEDADIIVIEDYWSPGRIIDTYNDVLSDADIKKIDDMPYQTASDEMGNMDERNNFVHTVNGNELSTSSAIVENYALFAGSSASTNYYDNSGNIKVVKVFWKSKRKVLKVKSYDEITGEEIENLYTEQYIPKKELGEEVTQMWINEAWEGTKIGRDIYINMRPREIQYNRLSNPSRCHFGIIGSVYNLNEGRPFSFVDMMKPYNYLYDVLHDRLNKAIATNWGAIMELDLANVPKGWTVEKWLLYAKNNKLAIKDSFKEGNVGQATGKLAGNFNASSRGIMQTNDGNYIQSLIQLLEYVKNEMGEVVGISKQREGQISNRETVGGVERATIQSAHSTEWLFLLHDDTIKRCLECLLETAKIASRGKSMKFQYILPDSSSKVIDFDGDEFAECDYGIVIDNSLGTQELAGKLDQLAHAALQNQTLSFSTIMKIYTSSSLAETQKMIENDEKTRQQSEQESAKAEREHAEKLLQLEIEDKRLERELKDMMNIRDNATKLEIAGLNSDDADVNADAMQKVKDAEIQNKKEESYNKQSIEREKIAAQQVMNERNAQLKEKEIAAKRAQSSTTK